MPSCCAIYYHTHCNQILHRHDWKPCGRSGFALLRIWNHTDCKTITLLRVLFLCDDSWFFLLTKNNHIVCKELCCDPFLHNIPFFFLQSVSKQSNRAWFLFFRLIFKWTWSVSSPLRGDSVCNHRLNTYWLFLNVSPGCVDPSILFWLFCSHIFYNPILMVLKCLSLWKPPG